MGNIRTRYKVKQENINKLKVFLKKIENKQLIKKKTK